jgi:hypothetical protein
MRFIKLIVVLVILGLIASFIWQNVPTFNAVQPFKLNLYFGQPMVWTHSVSSLLGIAAAIGFVVGILVMLKPYLGARKRLALERQGAKSQEAKPEQE